MRTNIIQELIAAGTLLAVGVAVYSSVEAKRANHLAKEANDLARQALSAPANMSVVAIDPLWKVEGKSPQESIRLALVSTITISNAGAQSGCVADLVIVLRLPLTGDERRFVAYYFADTRRLLEGLARNEPLHEAHEAPFAPLVILGRQQMSKSIVFRNVRFHPGDLRKGKFVLSILGNDCNAKEKWTKLWTATYIMDKSQASDLLRGQTTVFEREERITAIRSLQVNR